MKQKALDPKMMSQAHVGVSFTSYVILFKHITTIPKNLQGSWTSPLQDWFTEIDVVNLIRTSNAY